jgi:hypothetical protein
MGELCIIMHHITLCTPCIIFMLVSHTCIIVIGHEEQGPEETLEPTPVKAGNYEQYQGKPRCIPPKSLSFMFETLFIILYPLAH